MGQRHNGHPLSNAATASAHAPQKRECPLGTSATAERGCSRQTSKVSVAAFSYCGDVDVGASSWAVSTSMCAWPTVVFIKPCSHWRRHVFGNSHRIRRLLPNSATNCRRFRRLHLQCGQGLRTFLVGG